jgi:hypothetical protein
MLEQGSACLGLRKRWGLVKCDRLGLEAIVWAGVSAGAQVAILRGLAGVVPERVLEMAGGSNKKVIETEKTNHV